jgi:uncharacterized protein YndB with AHSA1/START domain
MNSAPFVIEQVYDSPIAKVWKAITDREQMKQWYFEVSAFRPEVGFEFTFEGGPPDQSYTHLCKVTEVVNEKKLSYTWSYKGYPGLSTLTFELFPIGDKTRLRLTHAGLETFPAETNPHFARKNFEGGWKQITSELLKVFLESE